MWVGNASPATMQAPLEGGACHRCQPRLGLLPLLRGGQNNSRNDLKVHPVGKQKKGAPSPEITPTRPQAQVPHGALQLLGKSVLGIRRKFLITAQLAAIKMLLYFIFTSFGSVCPCVHVHACMCIHMQVCGLCAHIKKSGACQMPTKPANPLHEHLRLTGVTSQ